MSTLLESYEPVTTTAPRRESVFNLEHNLTEYNKLVGSRYSDNVTTMPALESYTLAPTPRQLPSELYGASRPSETYGATKVASFMSQLESYNAPASKASTYIPVELDSYARHTPAVSQTATVTETATPTFRPNIEEYSQPKSTFRKSELFVPANYDLIVEKKTSFADSEVKEEKEIAYTTKYKLNPVGMVSVVSFIAVTVMILAFVISNAVTIGANSATITNLGASNTALSQEIVASKMANAEFIASYEEKFVELGLGGGLTLEQYLASEGFVSIPPQTVDVPATWQVAPAPVQHTNFFDWLSKALSWLF